MSDFSIYDDPRGTRCAVIGFILFIYLIVIAAGLLIYGQKTSTPAPTTQTRVLTEAPETPPIN